METIEVLRIINLTFTLVALISCIVRWYREKTPVLIAPISWLLHTLLFWIFRFIDLPIEIEIYNIWSSAIRLHACILIIGALIIFRREDIHG